MLIKDKIDITTNKFKEIHRVNIYENSCKYKFYIDIENKDVNTIKYILKSDIEKLLKSIKNHTTGNKITKEDIIEFKKGELECDSITMMSSYGWPYVPVYIEYPEDMYSYETQKLKEHTLLISGRPIFKNIQRYFCRLVNFTSNAGSEKRINTLIDDILNNILIDEITKINFYVCNDSFKNMFYMYILFDTIDENNILNTREQYHQEKI